MARGDVVSDIQTIATGNDLTYQPGAGVEVMITEIGSDVWTGNEPDRSPRVSVFLTDGAIDSRVRGTEGNATSWNRPLRLLINNTNYLKIVNNDGGNAVLSYTGIQTK